MSEDNGQKVEIDWLRTIAGALAAVSSAVLLSTLGAAGTLIGAALGSVIATVGGALYTQGLATSRAQLARAQETARLKVGIAQAELRRANRQQADAPAVDAHLSHAEERLDEARNDLDAALAEQPKASGWRERLGMLPWKRISLVAAGLFGAAILAITTFELATGEAVSSMTGGTDDGGGTTISRIGAGSDAQTPQDEPADDEQPPPADDPSAEPSTEPSAEPTEEPDPTPSEEPSLDPTPSLPTATSEPTEPTESPASG
jgi:hypothetical protein